MGSQALVHLLDPFLRLSLLLHQRPATEDRTERPPVRKALFCGEADGGFGTLLGGTSLAAELIEPGSHAQGKTEAKGVRNLLCQSQHFVHLYSPLGWIPQKPQRQRGINVASHTIIVPSGTQKRGMLLGIVERDTLCKVRVRRSDRAQPEQRLPHRTVR